jgi:parallel beta-helix repeat protein
MILGFIVIIIDITPVVKASITFYVDDVPGEGPGNPPEDFTSIQDALIAANDGDTIYVYNGSYYESVPINKMISLIGEDRNSTLIDRMGNGDDVIIFSDWTNITGFTIHNSGAAGSDAGINIDDANNVTISYNNIISNDLGIYITPSSSYNNIIGNNISGNDDDGIHMYSSFNNVIGNEIYSNGRLGLNFDSNGPYWRGNNIINNNISFNSYGMGFQNNNWSNIINNRIVSNTNHGLILFSASNNTIMDNNVSNNGYGIYLRDSNGNTIENNTSSNVNDGIHINTSHHNDLVDNVLYNNRYGMNIWNSSNNKISKNNISSSEGAGILLNYSNGNSLNENDIYSSGNRGIRLLSSSYNKIILNDIYSITWYGIELRNQSDENYIINNHIHSNGFGLTLWDSSNNTIIGNNLTQNNNENIGINPVSDNNVILNNDISYCVTGISISSSNNTITGNKIYSCGWAGISVGDASDNHIIKNNILDNVYGIYITPNSYSNQIYHNNLINNTIQALDENDNNLWNDSYPSGGNYWSDFDNSSEGAYDDYQGSIQIISGSDGIVDKGSGAGGGINPYVIDLDSRDNFPFISPVEDYKYLSEGWNLISIPLIQTETNVGTVLSTISGSYDAVQWFNVSDSLDPWKHNQTSKQEHLNDLNNINHTIGFWIHITEPGGVLFDYPGVQPILNQTIQLYSGWNLVGYPSLTNHNRTVGLNNLEIGTEVDAIQWFDAMTKTWQFMGPDDNFVPGRGYWVHSSVDVTWEVPL